MNVFCFQTHASPTSPSVSVRLPTSPSPQQIQSGHHPGLFSSGQLPLQLQMVKTENKSWPPQQVSSHYIAVFERAILWPTFSETEVSSQHWRMSFYCHFLQFYDGKCLLGCHFSQMKTFTHSVLRTPQSSF